MNIRAAVERDRGHSDWLELSQCSRFVAVHHQRQRNGTDVDTRYR